MAIGDSAVIVCDDSVMHQNIASGCQQIAEIHSALGGHIVHALDVARGFDVVPLVGNVLLALLLVCGELLGGDGNHPTSHIHHALAILLGDGASLDSKFHRLYVSSTILPVAGKNTALQVPV